MLWVAKHRVLLSEFLVLSEFLAWHCMLIQSLHVLPFRGEDDDEWDARWNPLDDDLPHRAERYRSAPIEA